MLVNLSILYNSAKNVYLRGARTHTHVYERLKHTHLASAATVLLLYVNSYIEYM
jgi:hypothetical protein